MPKPTDHEERRRFVVSVATSLILSDGLDAVTQRNVARAAGYSTAIVNHYFQNKQELLLLIYRTAAEAYRKRIEDIVATRRPALRDTLIGLLPLDEVSHRDWRVFCAFLGSGIAAPDLAREQAQRIKTTERRIAGLLAAERGVAEADSHAVRLMSFVNGLGFAIIIAPDEWNAEKAAMLVDLELETLGEVRPGQESGKPLRGRKAGAAGR